MKENAGYREIDHTADWALEVWAPDLLSLLRTSAEGMLALMGLALDQGPEQAFEIEAAGIDAEALLVAFLTEALRIAEEDGWAMIGGELDLDGFRVNGRIHAVPIRSQQKEIKAVTYHNLTIRETARGLETAIVFDV